MLLLNDLPVTPSHFPDGTQHLSAQVPPQPKYTISWFYENEEELATLIYLVGHLKAKGIKNLHLYMPYVPNARMDRVKLTHEVFTLKYFAQAINSLGFSSVRILDPHSHVSEALFDNVIVESPKPVIEWAKRKIAIFTNDTPYTIFYPDEGAMKRYSEMITDAPITFGIKQRDWATGQIKGLTVVGDTENIRDKNILIIDDICSRGGTFYHSAKKLKEMGAAKIFLYITHCERTIFDGEIFSSGLIDCVFTTDSIFGHPADELPEVARGKVEIWKILM